MINVNSIPKNNIAKIQKPMNLDIFSPYKHPTIIGACELFKEGKLTSKVLTMKVAYMNGHTCYIDNSRSDTGYTFLHFITQYGKPNWNYKKYKDVSPLYRTFYQLMNDLHQKGKFDLRDNHGRTPYSYACEYDYYSFVKDFGHLTDIHQTDNDGNTLLHAAAKGDGTHLFEIINYLLLKGVNPLEVNNYNRTFMDLLDNNQGYVVNSDTERRINRRKEVYGYLERNNKCIHVPSDGFFSRTLRCLKKWFGYQYSQK